MQGIATHRTNHPVPHGAFALLPLPPTSAAIPLLLRRILFLTSTIKQTHQSTSDFFNFPKKICVTVLSNPRPRLTCEAIMCCARVLAPSVTPNDPFSRSQRTLESQQSPLAEPLKAKEVARRMECVQNVGI